MKKLLKKVFREFAITWELMRALIWLRLEMAISLIARPCPETSRNSQLLTDLKIKSEPSSPQLVTLFAKCGELARGEKSGLRAGGVGEFVPLSWLSPGAGCCLQPLLLGEEVRAALPLRPLGQVWLFSV